MDENQRLTWLLRMPECAEINAAMQKVTKLSYETKDVHKELTPSRIACDNDDLEKLTRFLQGKYPFAGLVY